MNTATASTEKTWFANAGPVAGKRAAGIAGMKGIRVTIRPGTPKMSPAVTGDMFPDIAAVIGIMILICVLGTSKPSLFLTQIYHMTHHGNLYAEM